MDSVWDVVTSPCTTGPCQGKTCAVGEICIQTYNDAMTGDCVQNTCGTNPISCDCLHSCVGTQCQLAGGVSFPQVLEVLLCQ